MTKRIEKAIDIFLDAINNGTLAKGTCAACAVGNLVASGMGAKIYKENDSYRCEVRNGHWGILFATHEGVQDINNIIDDTIAIQNIEATDFSKEELMKIEFAFETNTDIYFNEYFNYTKEEIRQDQINGLAAVVKVMLEFDDVKESVQDVFISKANLIPIA